LAGILVTCIQQSCEYFWEIAQDVTAVENAIQFVFDPSMPLQLLITESRGASRP
jgi:hypothetical protein